MSDPTVRVVVDPAPTVGGTWHHGRRFHGPDRLSVECDCPKTPCGLTVFGHWDPACDFHGPYKTTRQAHPAEFCPGHEELT